MSFRQTLRFLGFNEDTVEWNETALQNKKRIEEVASLPFHTVEFQQLMKELSIKEKYLLANLLQFSFESRGRKTFPELLFQKELNQYILACKRDDENAKLRLFIALREILSPLLDSEDDFSLASFITNQYSLIQTYGPWHYYWSFCFHPGKMKDSLLWEQAFQGLSSQLLMWEKQEDFYDSNHGKSDDTTKNEEFLKNKLHKLESKTQKESQLRQELEEQLAKEKSEMGKLRVKLEQATNQINRLEAALYLEQTKVKETTNKYEQIHKQLREGQSAWVAEKSALKRQVQFLKGEIKEKEEAVKQKDQDIQALVIEIETMKSEKQQKRQAKDLVEMLVPLLYDEMGEWLMQLKATPLSMGSSGEALRQQIKDSLNLVDQLEKHVVAKNHIEAANPKVDATDNKVPMAAETKAAAQLVDGAAETKSRNGETEVQQKQASTESQSYKENDYLDEDTWFTGTFYRLDHGGVITLDSSSDSFKITESMVLEHELQHEAEVRCRPMNKEKGITYYDIELIFQGDDNYSDINHYDGYIELGEYHTFYCVELNAPEHKYKIHEKDVMIHQLRDGLPCTFNVANGSQIARISRIFKMYGPSQQKKDDSHGEPSSKNKSQKRKMKLNPEPYLQGARIAVVGGQKKWFESVVVETGAEFIHNDGYAPERIHADLKRADALFLFIQANSHRATWGCMDVAKEHNIPHFIIEGSKSNLRHLLWENRDTIKAKK